MFSWARIFLVTAIIAAIFGFVGGSSATTQVPRICFFVAITLSVASFIAGLMLPQPEVDAEFDSEFEPDYEMQLK